MIRKIFTLLLKIRSSANLFLDFADLTEFLHRPWPLEELFLIIMVAFWIPFIRIAAYLFLHFGLKTKFLVEHLFYKLILRCSYWFTAISLVFNLGTKFLQRYNRGNLFVLCIVALVMLSFDFFETEEVISKITEHLNKKL